MVAVPLRRTRPRGAANSSTSPSSWPWLSGSIGTMIATSSDVRLALEHARRDPLAPGGHERHRLRALGQRHRLGLRSAPFPRPSFMAAASPRARSDPIWRSRQPPRAGALEHVLGREPEPAGGLDGDAELVGLIGVGHRQRVRPQRSQRLQQLRGGGGAERRRQRDHDALGLQLGRAAPRARGCRRGRTGETLGVSSTAGPRRAPCAAPAARAARGRAWAS